MRLSPVFTKILLTFLPALAVFNAQAQTKKIDSLKQVLLTAPEDTQKVNTLNVLADKLWRAGNFDTCVIYAERARVLADRLKFSRGIAVADNSAGIACREQSEYTKALKYHYEALKIWEAIKDRKGLGGSYNNIGLVFYRQGDYPRALENIFTSLKIKEELGDKQGLVNSYTNIGNIYNSQGNYPEALKNHQLALEIAQGIDDKRGTAGALHNLGNIYENMGNYPEALKNLFAALKINRETGNGSWEANNYSGMGNVYYSQGNYAEALKSHFTCLAIAQKLGNEALASSSLINIGLAHLRQKNYPEAEHYLLKGLEISRSINDLESVKEASQSLSEIYEATGKFKASLEFYRAYITAKDSLNNEENTKKTVRLLMNYEFDKKEAAARVAQETKEVIAAAESRRQRIILLSVSALGVVVLIFAIFAYRNFLQKKKANDEISRQKAIIEAKQKEILDSIYYAGRIQRSLLTNDWYIDRHLKRLNPKS